MSRKSIKSMADLYYKTTPGWGYTLLINDRVEGVTLLRDGHAGQHGTVIDIYERHHTSHYLVAWDDGTKSEHYSESLLNERPKAK